MTNVLNVSPAHLGIPKIFWLQLAELPDSPQTDPPYFRAISTLQQLPQLNTPMTKVNCLVETGNAIITAVRKHWEGKLEPEKLLIGGDEFLPLFTYIIIKAGVPNLSSESFFLENFINDFTSKDQGGYLAVTLQTCLSFLTQLKKDEMEKIATELMQKEMEKEKEKALNEQAQKTDSLSSNQDSEKKPSEVVSTESQPPTQQQPADQLPPSAQPQPSNNGTQPPQSPSQPQSPQTEKQTVEGSSEVRVHTTQQNGNGDDLISFD